MVLNHQWLLPFYAITQNQQHRRTAANEDHASLHLVYTSPSLSYDIEVLYLRLRRETKGRRDRSIRANIFASISRVLGHHNRAAFILFQDAASSKRKGLRRVCVCDCVEGKDTVACWGQEASCARSHGYIKNNGWGIQTWQSIICKRDAHREHRQWDLNHFQAHRSLSIYAAELSRKSASPNESGEIIQVSYTQNNFGPFFKVKSPQ